MSYTLEPSRACVGFLLILASAMEGLMSPPDPIMENARVRAERVAQYVFSFEEFHYHAVYVMGLISDIFNVKESPIDRLERLEELSYDISQLCVGVYEVPLPWIMLY